MNDQPANDAVAIGVLRESESGKGLEEILKDDDEPRHRWNTIFTISCAIAIFIDPLYCYAPVIHVHEKHKCLKLDQNLLWTYIGLRSAVDVFYAIDFVSWCKKTFGVFTVLGSKGEKKEPVSWCMKTFGTFWTKSSQKTEVLYLILVSLPLPEGLILSAKCSYWDPTYALIISTPVQYSLRIYHIYVTLKRRRPNQTRVGKWLKAALDYLPFVLLLISFGSNLQTSLYTVEIFLSVMISISGMVLFLVYLNARVQMQESQELLDQSKSKKKQSQELLDQSESKKKQSLKLWLDKNEIRPNTGQMETIMNNIHKLEENKDIDVQNMLSILPVDDKKSIIQLLCLASLKKVPVFENIDQNILIAICDHLKPVTYTEDSYIVQEGRPLGKMLFIVEGLAWTYTTSNIIDVGTLKRGDYYGEEVLTWAFQPPSFSGLPISTRTVMSQEKIEAFAIRAGDLKSVVCKFRCHFRKKVDFSQLQLWENGASVMQSLKSQVIDITPCP